LAALVRMQEDKAQPNFEAVDEESLQRVYKFLADKNTGLSHLTDVVKKDVRDLNIIADSFLSDKGRGDM